METDKWGITDDNGEATIMSSPIVAEFGTALFAVTDITGSGAVYDVAADLVSTAEADIPQE